MKPFGHLAGAANHFATDALVRAAVFQHEPRVRRQAVLHDNRSALRSHAKRKRVQSR